MTTLTVDVSNSDLFGGDLFGDELIYMYGATEVPETEPSINQGILQESSDNNPTAIDNSSNNVGQVIAPKVENGRSDVAALDLDDLGSFRRTSYNEFAELLPPPTFPLTTAGSGSMQVPLSPATASVSDSSTTLEHHASQSILSYVAGSSTTNNTSDVNPATGTLIKTNMALADINYVAVVSSSLLPTETGVQANQQAVASQSHTPDPLEASRQRIVQQNRIVSNNAIAPTAHVEQRSIPDQIKSQITTTTVQLSNATVPVIVNSNAQLQTKNTSTASDAVSQATVTAAAVAAATNVPSAAEIAAVAQEAVSNLIMNAGAHSSTNASQQNLNSSNIEVNGGFMMNSTGSLPVSTARVTALTSANWASAVNNNTNNTIHAAPMLVRNNTSITSDSAYSLDQQHTDTQAPAAKRRRQNLTPDERAKQNRDRNREHARNTRLRKKAFVEELKHTLTELVTQRNADETEKRRVAQLELEQREVRFRVDSLCQLPNIGIWYYLTQVQLRHKAFSNLLRFLDKYLLMKTVRNKS